MKLALVTVDNREDARDYALPEPYFAAATEALLQGFALVPDLEVHVISCIQKPVKSPEKLADNIWFHSIYVPKMGWMRSSYQGCVRAVRRKLKQIKPDVVHGQGTERECAISAALSRFPNLITIHGNMAELARLFKAPMGSIGWLAAQLEDIALKRTLGVLCNSDYTEGLVKPRAARTWRVPNAIRMAFLETPRTAASLDKFVLLNVGVISERKRQLELLDLARRLHEQGLKFELHFAGGFDPGAYAEKFKAQLPAAEAAGYARYSGQKSISELIACMDGAHGWVHFPDEDAFGVVATEALARDMKLFASRVGGIVDIVAGAPGAELYAQDDWDGLAGGIAKWIGEGCPRLQGGSAIMAERCHPRVIAQRHIEIYREVLSKES